MLFPDFILGEMILSEAILYPMLFAMMALAYCYLNGRKLLHMLGVGVLGGLLYATKPGYIVAPSAVLVVCMALAIKERSKKGAVQAVIGLGIMAGIIALMYVAAYGLGYHSGALAVYEEQLSSVHPDAFLRAVVKYPYYFILACGVIAFALPFKLYPDMSKETKAFFYIVITALTGVILGTAWVINGYEYATNTVHMRYIGPYVMLFLMLSYANVEKKNEKQCIKAKEKKRNWGEITAYSTIIFTVMCSFILGCGVGTDSGTLAIANLSLAILNKLFLPEKNVAIGSAIAIIACIVAAVALAHWSIARTRKVCVGIAAGLFLMSSIAGYRLIQRDTRFEWIEETRELGTYIGDQEYLYVCTSERIINNASLDVNSNKNICYVSLNDLFNHVYEENGQYKPFVPQKMRGRISDRMTPETNLLVMEPSAFEMVKLSEAANYIATESKHLYLIRLPEKERWVDSIIGNIENNALDAGETGVLVIYDEELLDSALTIRMEIGANQNVQMTFFCNGEMKQMEITAGRAWYDFTFANPEHAYNFICEESELTIYRYELVQ